MVARTSGLVLLASGAVYLSADDAKTDVILAAAAAVFGVPLRQFVAGLPVYPGPGVTASALDVLWILALTALVPYLLARHRGDGRAAFGLDGAAGGWTAGIVIALPVVVLGIVALMWLGLDPAGAVLGSLAAVDGGAIGGADAVIMVARVAATAAGALLLFGFLSVRGRDGFPRSPQASLTALVRTIGMGAVPAALVLGALSVVRAGPGASFMILVLNVAALAAVVLVGDRLVPAGITLHRTAVVTPVVVVVVAHLFATGGLLFGDLLGGLYRSALAAGTTVIIAALAQTRPRAWAAVPLVVAVHWWPTCLSPLALTAGVCF